MALAIISTVMATCGVKNICDNYRRGGFKQVVAGGIGFSLGYGVPVVDTVAMLGTSITSGLFASGIDHLYQRKTVKGICELAGGSLSAYLTAAVIDSTSPLAALPSVLKFAAGLVSAAIVCQSFRNEVARQKRVPNDPACSFLRSHAESPV